MEREAIYSEKHYTSTVFLVTKEDPKRVLFVHHNKFGKWLPPGGHQEMFEDPVEAAVREVYEETGINIAKHVPPARKIDERVSALFSPAYVLEVNIGENKKSPEHTHLDMIYVIEIPYQDVKYDENESSDIKWFTHEETKELDLFENIHVLLEEIFNR